MRKRSRPEGDEDVEVIDLRERLAPYAESDLRPGWREDLIKADARRARRPLRAAPLATKDR